MFDNVSLSPETIARVNAILSVVVPLLVVLISGALSVYAGKQFSKQLRDLYRLFRPQIKVIVEQIDEPTDDPVEWIAKVSPVAARLIVAFGPTIIKAIQSELDKMADIPPQEVAQSSDCVEVNIGGA
jgi:uncharacterized protein YneF (UPF0154 family)